MPIEDTFRDTDDDNEGEKEKEKDANTEELKIEKKDVKENEENDEKKEVGENVDENAEETEVVDQEKGDLDSQDVKDNEDLKAVDDAQNNDKPESSPMEISESMDNNINKLKDNNNIEENGENIAVKALKEAFDAVGSLSSLDEKEKFSFADAGNPVMAMAAFLTRLVEPDIVTASARASLKSVSSGGTGLQLSARHCFVLEDPTDEKKPDETEKSMNIDVPEAVEQDDSKENNDSLNDHNDKEVKDTEITETEKEKSLVSNEKKEDSDTVKTEVVVSKKGKHAGSRKKGSSKKDKIPVTEKSVITEETNKDTNQVENPSDSKMETENSVDVVPPITETADAAPKDEEMTEKTEDPQSTLSETVEIPVEENKGEAEEKNSNIVNKDSVETKEDQNMQNLTRAAVTAISAAAVKAKLLADQEEDSIRQLATSLMEKQLHKLETKLAFFTEMDGVVSRAREQLERSKQRLYHERAQIIAARLGMSAAAANSTRPMQHLLPNRAGTPLPNMAQRPPNLNPMTMAPQRPPLSRPMVGPTPPFSNPTGPTPVAGNPPQVSNNPGMK